MEYSVFSEHCFEKTGSHARETVWRDGCLIKVIVFIKFGVFILQYRFSCIFVQKEGIENDLFFLR